MSGNKKWYNYFVTVDAPAGAAPEAPAPQGKGSAARKPSAAQTVADIAAGIDVETKIRGPVADPASFDDIYRAADIRVPAHGYSIMKIAEMLQSEHIRHQPAEIKRGSILVALEAAGVKLQEVIEDAVRRDRALDTYERVQQKALQDLEAAKAAENQQVQAEIDRVVAQQRARIQANTDAVAKEKERFRGWCVKKQQEEERIAQAVSHFVSENPISLAGPAAARPASPTPRGS